MNDGPRLPQLLDRSHVAMAECARENVHLAQPRSCFSWADPALRTLGKAWASVFPLYRVPTTEKPSVECGRPDSDIQRPLRRNALPDCCGQAMGDERAGSGRLLLSKKQETEWA